MTAINEQKFINVRQVGKGGINAYDDPQDIQDIEVVDAQNMLFDNAAETRPGSKLKWRKPVGETNDLLCLFDAHTSDGLQYVIAVYAPNFYLRDETNNQWIKINNNYTPTTANIALMYSYVNWNAGRGADSLYACNGTDDFIKWPIAFSTLTVATGASDGTVTVADASYFPASGVLLLQELNGTQRRMPYTSKSGNVITLTGTTGFVVGIGAGVTCEIADMSGMAKGKVLAIHQRRLFVANYYGGEANMKYSNTELPEDFSTGTGVTKGGVLTISDGNGGITLMTDFGQYLIIAKEDGVVHFEFNYNATLDAKLDTLFPVVSDKSMGPVNVWSTIKKNKTVYYPTATEGILDLAPVVTGLSINIGVEVRSRKIQSLYQALNFQNSRTTTFLNKILWSCATNTANDTVLVYDTLRDYWTRVNNWNVKDWSLHNSQLLFGSRVDGNIYQALTPNNYSDNDTPYLSYFKSKNYDFGEPSLPKTTTALYLQGYISANTSLYIDIEVSQGNSVTKATYLITGNGALVAQVIPEAMAMVMLGLPIMGMGSTLTLDNKGTFRAYLALPVRNGFYTVNYKPYSTKAGDYWAVTGVGFNPTLVNQIPAGMTVGVLGEPTTSAVFSSSSSSSDTAVLVGTRTYNEVPAGTINGINKIFTFAKPPINGTIEVYVDGVRFNLSDYTIVDRTLTLAVAPTTELVVAYNHY